MDRTLQPPSGMSGAFACAARGWVCVAVAVATSACSLPSSNVGRPVAPGKAALTMSVGQAVGASEFDGYVEPDGDGPPPRKTSEYPQGLGVPASATAGLRMGLGSRFDLGGELSLSHVGLNTRVAAWGATADPNLVLTLDGRLGLLEETEMNEPFPPYDLTSRLFAYLLKSERSAFLAGGGFSWGRFEHLAVRDSSGFSPSFEFVYTRELRVHGLLGFSLYPGKNSSELCLYLDPYLVLDRQKDAAFDYQHYGGAVLSLATTVVFGD